MIPRVRPGVLDVRARLCRPAKRLSKVDFPTFDLPAMAISGGPAGGSEPSVRVSAMNVAERTSGALIWRLKARRLALLA